MLEVVGRKAELDAARRFLDAIPTGPCALVLEGEAGIGKTTLWSACMARQGQGARPRMAERLRLVFGL